MKNPFRAAGAILAISLFATNAAYAAPMTYQEMADILQQDQKELEPKELKDGKEVLTRYFETDEKVYVAVGETVIRDLPDSTAKGMKKVTLGKWLHCVGLCENGWSMITYRDKDRKKCIGYLESWELSDQVQIQPVSEEVTAAQDVEILDYPGLKDGQVIGEYIEGDTVQRVGACNEAWSQVTFENDQKKEITGYVPNEALDGIQTEEKEDISAETEAGVLRPPLEDGIFVEASNKITAGGVLTDGVVVGDAVQAPEGAKLLPLGNFRITHYCPCSLCCGPWTDGITSTGITATTNRTIAVDPSQIPYGSKVVINGQVYVAEDCGGAIKKNCIDIYVASHAEGEAKGVYYTDVYLLEE